MPKLLFIFFISWGLWGQATQSPAIVFRPSAPTGACTPGVFNWQDTVAGTQYTCVGSTWTAIAGGGGSGLTSLNGLTASTQTFATTNDTNVTLGVTSSSSTHG